MDHRNPIDLEGIWRLKKKDAKKTGGEELQGEKSPLQR